MEPEEYTHEILPLRMIEMDGARNYFASNRSTIVSVLYFVAIVVLAYYLYRFYTDSYSRDTVLLKSQIETSAAKRDLVIYKSGDDMNKRVGSEYTISFWMFINQYANTSEYQSLFALMDGTDDEFLLAAYLHPKKPNMVVRAGKIMGNTTIDTLVKKTTNSIEPPVSEDSLTPCDVSNIDLQRWMHVAISVNGQILDVYVDGKLARSCILPSVQNITADGSQQLTLFHSGTTYKGFISGVQVSSYAATPDQIYSQYRGGPYASVGFLDYLWSKIGISIKYASSS
jgi:hypothetical protein